MVAHVSPFFKLDCPQGMRLHWCHPWEKILSSFGSTVHDPLLCLGCSHTILSHGNLRLPFPLRPLSVSSMAPAGGAVL